MAGLAKLLDEARLVGLTVRAEGDTLVVRGPRAAEPLAMRLLARKAEVLALLERTGAERAHWGRTARGAAGASAEKNALGDTCDTGDTSTDRPEPDPPASRLHPCPGCAAEGRAKLIPWTWERCATCDPKWSTRAASQRGAGKPV